MSLQEEIKKAVTAHGMWKKRLLDAIALGKSDFNPDNVCKDNLCDFGKWFYGPSVPAAAKKLPEFEAIRDLHGKFHNEASNVLKMALSGQREKAVAALSSQSDFTTLSTSLTQTLMKWSVAVGDME